MIAILILQLVMHAPDPTLTPGVVRPLNGGQVCGTKWGHDRRFVTEAMKQRIAVAYHIPRNQIVASGKGPCCEFDHLVPRELGGADDERNIWPQAWPEARVKDREENRLHVAVCAGMMTLDDAQQQMRHWGHVAPLP